MGFVRRKTLRQIVFTGTPDEMRANDDVRRKWLEVS